MASTSQPPEWLDPYHPPLENKEVKDAVKELIVDETPAPGQYPKVVRSQVDIPISSQEYGLISWMLFPEPKKLQNGSLVYGFIKLRGNYSDANLCKNRAAEIIRTQDSKNKIRILSVGSWLPIMNDDSTTKEIVNVDVDDDPLTPMREEAVKDAEKEQARIVRELKERENEIKNSKDYNDDTEHIDYYTMKRVAWMGLFEQKQILQKQIESISDKLINTRKLLHGLEKRYPNYSEDWISNYNKERKKAGIPDYVPSTLHEEEYSRSLENL